jgi:hypothetical protein
MDAIMKLNNMTYGIYSHYDIKNHSKKIRETLFVVWRTTARWCILLWANNDCQFLVFRCDTAAHSECTQQLNTRVWRQIQMKAGAWRWVVNTQ